MNQTILPTSLQHIPVNIQNFIGHLSEVVLEAHKADSEHQLALATFQEAMQSLQLAEKLKIQTLEKIDQGKTRDTKLEVELNELEQKMNDINGKRVTLMKAMQIREWSLERIDKKVTKLSREKRRSL